MTIYAITKGYYSDYRICALTVSKDKAERLKLYFLLIWSPSLYCNFEDTIIKYLIQHMDEDKQWFKYMTTLSADE